MQRMRDVHLRIDPVIAELAFKGRWNMSAVLEDSLMKRMGISKTRLVDLRKQNKFVGRPTHSNMHPRKITIYSGVDGKEYCIDD